MNKEIVQTTCARNARKPSLTWACLACTPYFLYGVVVVWLQLVVRSLASSLRVAGEI